MENNGKGLFYGVIGVATLIVAIIGATFAFFSAQATPGEGSDAITGQTNEDIASALTISVTKANTAVEGVNPHLVPANIDGTQATVANAAANNCVASGYTGCHIYEITATSSQNLEVANINLSTLTVDARVKTNWGYAIYRGTSYTQLTSLVTSGSLDLASAYDMHQGAEMTDARPEKYYLMVYLKNVSSDQAGDDKEYGTYNGSVSFSAAGGEVSASFSAVG